MFRNVDSSLQEGSLCCLGRFTTRKLEISRFNSFIKSPLYPRITALKFSIKDFFSKCDQIRSKLRIWSHLLKKFLMENFVFCVVYRKTARYFFLVIQRFSCITQHIKEHSTFLKSNNLRYKKKKKNCQILVEKHSSGFRCFYKQPDFSVKHLVANSNP